MPTLSITKSYQDGDVLLEADLDNIRDGVTNFVNTTKLNSDNIQTGGISADNLASSSVTTAKIADSNVTKAKLEAQMQFFPGMIVPVGGDILPTGWLYCNGQAVSRSTYADLYAAIGVRHGQGDGSTTFNLPDYRGQFLRGWADGQSTDPDRSSRTAPATGGQTGDNVGSVQTSAYAAHTHDTGTLANSSDGAHTHYTLKNIDAAGSVSGTRYTTTSYTTAGNDNAYTLQGSDQEADTAPTTSSGAHTHSLSGATGSSGSGTETRPRNAYVKYLIKY